MFRALVFIVTLALPWQIRRRLYAHLYGWKIHPTATIGYSLVLAKHVEMDAGARIGNLCYVKGLELVRLGEHASLGSYNLVTGVSKDQNRYFSHQPDRIPSLVLGNHAAITLQHVIDCSATVTIGAFTTVAGYRTQILSHSIDINTGRQHAEPVTIGAFCFIGTHCVILPGARLPNRSVLGAQSLLNKTYNEELTLYGGIPAKPLTKLEDDAGYFNRSTGHVY